MRTDVRLTTVPEDVLVLARSDSVLSYGMAQEWPEMEIIVPDGGTNDVATIEVQPNADNTVDDALVLVEVRNHVLADSRHSLSVSANDGTVINWPAGSDRHSISMGIGRRELTVVDDAGRIARKVINVKLRDQVDPTVAIQATPEGVVPFRSTVTLEAVANPAGSYQYEWVLGEEVIGAGDRFLYQAMRSGVVTVRLLDSNGTYITEASRSIEVDAVQIATGVLGDEADNGEVAVTTGDAGAMDVCQAASCNIDVSAMQVTLMARQRNDLTPDFGGWSGSPVCDGATEATITVPVQEGLSCIARFDTPLSSCTPVAVAGLTYGTPPNVQTITSGSIPWRELSTARLDPSGTSPAMNRQVFWQLERDGDGRSWPFLVDQPSLPHTEMNVGESYNVTLDVTCGNQTDSATFSFTVGN